MREETCAHTHPIPSHRPGSDPACDGCLHRRSPDPLPPPPPSSTQNFTCRSTWKFRLCIAHSRAFDAVPAPWVVFWAATGATGACAKGCLHRPPRARAKGVASLVTVCQKMWHKIESRMTAFLYSFRIRNIFSCVPTRREGGGDVARRYALEGLLFGLWGEACMGTTSVGFFLRVTCLFACMFDGRDVVRPMAIPVLWRHGAHERLLPSIPPFLFLYKPGSFAKVRVIRRRPRKSRTP